MKVRNKAFIQGILQGSISKFQSFYVFRLDITKEFELALLNFDKIVPFVTQISLEPFYFQVIGKNIQIH
jgi:hypothetical protein